MALEIFGPFMITGASNSDCIIILIDARNGVIEQTRRHSIIASLLRIPHVIVAINKMDMVGYDKSVFTSIVSQYQEVARELQLEDVYYIPISALKGDNIIHSSPNLNWFNGDTLLSHLENIEVEKNTSTVSRFSVQYVIRPQADHLHV